MRTITKALLAGATFMAGLGVPAATADDSPWQVRVRLISVSPDESSTITFAGQNTSGTLPGAATASTEYVPELDITYFFNKNVSAELILATSRHDIVAAGTPLGDVPVGKVGVLPPTLLAQYHFAPDAKIRPYIGAGINYTFFYNEDAEGTAFQHSSYEDGFGLALQAGVDFDFNEDSPWFFNLDVKKIWLSTDVELGGPVTGPLEVEVDLNPWVFGAGFGYRF